MKGHLPALLGRVRGVMGGESAAVDPEGFIVTILGRVQGVNFRHFVWVRAKRLGLTGYVRNLPSGCEIEVRAEGNRKGLEELLPFLELGPPEARVEKVEVCWADYTGTFLNFEIRS